MKPGDVITMAAECKQTVISGESGLRLIEVQLGRDNNSFDIKKCEMQSR